MDNLSLVLILFYTTNTFQCILQTADCIATRWPP